MTITGPAITLQVGGDDKVLKPCKVAIAVLFSVRPETINKRIRQLLDQAGHTIQPGPHRLASGRSR